MGGQWKPQNDVHSVSRHKMYGNAFCSMRSRLHTGRSAEEDSWAEIHSIPSYG